MSYLVWETRQTLVLVPPNIKISSVCAWKKAVCPSTERPCSVKNCEVMVLKRREK